MPAERPLFGEVWTTLTPTGANLHAVIANPSMTEGPSYATGNVIVLVTTTGQRIRLPPHGISGWAFEAPAYFPVGTFACVATGCRRTPRFLMGSTTAYCPIHLPKGVRSEIISAENDGVQTSQLSSSQLPLRLGACAFCGWEDIEATPLQVNLQDILSFRAFHPSRHFNYSCPRCQAIYLTAEIDTPREDLEILRAVTDRVVSFVCSPTADQPNIEDLIVREGVQDHLIFLVSRMPRRVETSPTQEVPLPQIPAIGSQWVNRIDRSIVFVDRFSSPENPRAGAVHFRTSEPGTLAPMPFHDFLSYFSPLQERSVAPTIEIPCKPGEEWENRVGVYSDLYKIVETNTILGTVIVEDAAGQRRSIRAAEMASGWEKVVRVSVFDRLTGEDFI